MNWESFGLGVLAGLALGALCGFGYVMLSGLMAFRNG